MVCMQILGSRAAAIRKDKYWSWILGAWEVRLHLLKVPDQHVKILNEAKI